MKFFITVFVFLSINVLAETAATKACLGLGENPTGTSIGQDKDPKNQCCKGLTTTSTKEACGQGHGGYSGVCLNCGDGKCDRSLESNCNCPKDCPDK